MATISCVREMTAITVCKNTQMTIELASLDAETTTE